MSNRTLARTLIATLLGLVSSWVLAQPPATVVVDTVKRSQIAPTVGVSGTVLSLFDSRLSAEVEGRVLWFADVGSEVSQGDTLVQLENSTLAIQRDEFAGQVEAERARLTFLEPEVERLRTLSEQSNAAQSLFDQRRSDLEVAHGDLEVADARLRQIEDQLSKTTIVAPFDGVVSERLVNLGEMINRLDIVVRLVSPAMIEIVARAPLNAVAFIESGTELRIHNDYREGYGTVRTIVPFGDPQSHMFEIRIDVPQESWIVGESVRVEVPTAAPRTALVVPRDALILREEGTYVFRVNGDPAAERVPVSVGSGTGEVIEIDGNLAPDDAVVVRGGERLNDGQPVSIVER